MPGDPRARRQPPGHVPAGHVPPDGAGRAAPAGSPAPILDQAFDGDSLPALRAAVAAHAARAGLPPHRADDFVVAAHELAANAVLHGAGHGRLRLWHRETALDCEVTDDGRPPAPGARPGPRDAARWRAERGHGIWLVRHVADEASLRSGPGGTVATVSFTLPPG